MMTSETENLLTAKARTGSGAFHASVSKSRASDSDMSNSKGSELSLEAPVSFKESAEDSATTPIKVNAISDRSPESDGCTTSLPTREVPSVLHLSSSRRASIDASLYIYFSQEFGQEVADWLAGEFNLQLDDAQKAQ
jgi:hypothetical protein